MGTTKPNQFGIFDMMYGNAWEWVQDRYIEYPADLKTPWVDKEDSLLQVTNDAKRIRRGGSWSYDKQDDAVSAPWCSLGLSVGQSHG